jgi:hypothetical protein
MAIPITLPPGSMPRRHWPFFINAGSSDKLQMGMADDSLLPSFHQK